MLDTDVCPNLTDLSEFIRGECRPEAGLPTARHIFHCRTCQQSLRESYSSELLLANLNALRSTSPAHLSSLIDLLMLKLTNENETKPQEPNPAETSVMKIAPCQIPQWREILRPAELPDEFARLGNYSLRRMLGQGGMGGVFEAVDLTLQRRVALKVMLPDIAKHPKSSERFLREGRAMASVVSDYIVTVYQVGVDNDIPYLAMEFLRGESLATRLERTKRLPFAEVLRIASDVAHGLAAAHEQGLVHRDVKPANIWIEYRTGKTSITAPGAERAKLLDFGLVHDGSNATHLTANGVVIGTPHFMAPEQARGQPSTAKSDLFSLGAVIFRIVTGSEPFPGTTTMSVLMSLASHTPPPLDDIIVGVPEGLGDLTQRLLSHDVNARPESAKAVILELEDIEKKLSADSRGLIPAIKPTFLDQTRSSNFNKVSTIEDGAGIKRPAGVSRASWIGFAAVIFMSFGLGLWNSGNSGLPPLASRANPIRVGVLFSTTGRLQHLGEKSIDATLLAISEINAAGGLLGRRVDAIECPGDLDVPHTAAEAKDLIQKANVAMIVGGATAPYRKAIKTVVEQNDHLLVCAAPPEGLDISKNVLHCGAVPNQQIPPLVRYCIGEGKRRLFFVGTDNLYSRVCARFITEELKRHSLKLASETYLPFGQLNFEAVVRSIDDNKSDVVVHAITGDINGNFFQQFRTAGLSPDAVSVYSLTLTETDVRSVPSELVAGIHTVASYYTTLDVPTNRAFVERFQAKYGAHRMPTERPQSAYQGVHLWAKAVTVAGSADPRAVRAALPDLTLETPEGIVRVDRATLHLTKHFRINRIDAGGKFKVVKSDVEPKEPEPFPAFMSRDQWDEFVQSALDAGKNKKPLP